MKKFSLPPGTIWSQDRGVSTVDDQRQRRRERAARDLQVVIQLSDASASIFSFGSDHQDSGIKMIAVQLGNTKSPSIQVDIGAVPKLENGLGLVLTSPMRLAKNSLRITGKMDEMELRSGILLWKHLVFPVSNVLDVQLGSDMQFLVDEGVATRVKAIASGRWDAAMAVTDTIAEVVEQLRQRDHGAWTIARGDRSLSVHDEVNRHSSALFRLQRAIPIPDSTVPMAEILEFKVRRSSELERLNKTVDSIARQVSEDVERPLSDVLQENSLAEAIDAHMRVSREFKFPFRIASVDVKIDLKTWMSGSAAYAWTAAHPVPIRVGSALLGAAAASVTIKPGLRRRSSDSPYEYVWKYHRELFGA